MTQTNKIKPMLAYTVKDVSKLSYPLLASAKLDGIRMLVIDSVCYSRSLKPIRSAAVQQKFGKPEYNGFDGELIYGNATDEHVFNTTTKVVMSKEMPEWANEEDICFHVFDMWNSDENANDTYAALTKRLESISTTSGISLVTKTIASTEASLTALQDELLSLGYEGVMVVGLQYKYKYGRSTAKENGLGKVKLFEDAEATIIGTEELLTNTNKKEVNELGYSERSQCKEGLIGASTLGALVCVTPNGIEFKIGTGFDAATRKELWENRDTLIGKLVKYKYFSVGQLVAPRFPTFLGIRDEDDVS